MTRAYTKEWFEERCVEAQTPQHKFEIVIAMHLLAQDCSAVGVAHFHKTLHTLPHSLNFFVVIHGGCF